MPVGGIRPVEDGRWAAKSVRDARTFNVYGYSFALKIAKRVMSVTLPNSTNVKVRALDLVA